MLCQINKINLGQRIRIDVGDIQELADSIKKYGLLHPIVIDEDYNLVAGGRRLLACEKLGWKTIEVTELKTLTPRELKVLELEENIKRKDFTEIEKSRALASLAELKAEELRELAEHEARYVTVNGPTIEDISKWPDTKEFISESENNSKVGRKDKPDGLKNIAREIGVPVTSIHDARQHVKAVDKYPELEQEPKYKAIETARELDKGNVVSVEFKPKDDFSRENTKKIDKMTDTLLDIAYLDADDETLRVWRETAIDETLADHYLSRIEEGLPKLIKIQKFLKEVKANGKKHDIR